MHGPSRSCRCWASPADFLRQHLSGWTGPVVLYRAVGKHTEADLSRWLTEVDADRVLTVLVGAAFRHQAVKTRLADAYRLHAGLDRRPTIGGVCIAERHVGTGRGSTGGRRASNVTAATSSFPTSPRPRPHPRPAVRLLRPPGRGSGPSPSHPDPCTLRIHEDPEVHVVARHRRPTVAPHLSLAGRTTRWRTPTSSACDQRPRPDRLLPQARPAVRRQCREPDEPQG